ncbi:MAG: oligosaccharide flippase family protein [Spirochaetaceae bacterium]
MKIPIKKWLNQSFIRRIIKNSGTLLTGSFGGSLLGLISFALIIRILGSNLYGQFVIMETYMQSFNQLFNFQCWQALISFGSEALEKKDITKFKELIKTGLMFDVLSAILGTVVALLLTEISGAYLNWTADQIFLTRIFSLLILFNITGTPIGVLRLLKKFKYISAHKIIVAVIKLIAVTIAWLLHIESRPFIILLMILLLVDQLTIIIISIIVLKQNNLLDFWKSKIGDWKPFVKFALWTNIESTINLPKKKLDKIFISKFLSYEAVSTFALFGKFNQILTKITSSIYYAVFPELSQKIAKGERKSAIKEGFKIGIILLAIGLPFFLIFAISIKWLLGPIFGYEFEKYYLLLIFYVGYNYLSVLFTALDPLIISLGYVKNKVSINIISNVAFLAVIFSLHGKWGLMGFLLADILQRVIVYYMKIRIIRKKEYKKELN